MSGRPRKPAELLRNDKIISSLYLQGLTQCEIADRLDLCQPQVSRRLAEFREQWQEDARQDIAERQAELLAKYQQIYADSYNAFLKKGFPGHLKNCLQALASISRLFGMDKFDVQLTASVGISSLSIHQQIDQSNMEQAKLELETWHQEMTNGANRLTVSPREPSRRLQPVNDTSAIVIGNEPVEPKPAESEPEPEPEVLPDNYLSITDPNHEDFPLTI